MPYKNIKCNKHYYIGEIILSNSAYQSSYTKLLTRSFTIWSCNNRTWNPDKPIFLEKFMRCKGQCIPHPCNLKPAHTNTQEDITQKKKATSLLWRKKQKQKAGTWHEIICYKIANNGKQEAKPYRTKSICSRTEMSFCSQKFSADPFLLDWIGRITLPNLKTGHSYVNAKFLTNQLLEAYNLPYLYIYIYI